MDGAYRDRAHGARDLAAALADLRGTPDMLVLGLPRGGVPVAAIVADAIGAELDCLIVRKLGTPHKPELAFGAIASDDVITLDDELVAYLRLDRPTIGRVVARERDELSRREKAYRGDSPPARISDRVVILVDDGLATGSTMKAAIDAVQARAPRTLIVGAPVGSADTCRALRARVDRVECPLQPRGFGAVGAWYREFRATSDAEVRAALARNNA